MAKPFGLGSGCPPAGRPDDGYDDGIEIREDLVLGDAKHVPPETYESPVPRRIVPTATFVIAAIDLDDEADLRASKVYNELPDDELPAKRPTGLVAREPAPEPLLGTSRREAHRARALFEQPRACRRDDRPSEHGELRGVRGARVRRAKPSAQVP